MVFDWAEPGDLPQILQLLERANLPTDDLGPELLGVFLVARRDGRVIGSGGLEPFGDIALLRSVAVDPTARGSGLGSRIVQALERKAEHLGIDNVFLLTTTATEFFRAQGYAATPREGAPAPIRTSTQFSTLCPDTAVFMHKAIGSSASAGETYRSTNR